ncbi:unnamed protein product [Caenorhabditis auriculariae]|uniref:Uncharacterized protein n=1 Tax=Caenorhabditis auriculariae TaxID=2777116 RepID=A0A8S1HWA3_9PELO|nr:unnamed protein product [Caenorhabditis auriculariae]
MMLSIAMPTTMTYYMPPYPAMFSPLRGLRTSLLPTVISVYLIITLSALSLAICSFSLLRNLVLWSNISFSSLNLSNSQILHLMPRVLIFGLALALAFEACLIYIAVDLDMDYEKLFPGQRELTDLLSETAAYVVIVSPAIITGAVFFLSSLLLCFVTILFGIGW